MSSASFSDVNGAGNPGIVVTLASDNHRVGFYASKIGVHCYDFTAQETVGYVPWS